MTKSLSIIEGKSRLKQRRASKQTISKEQLETFFETLENSCNVVRSARAAKINASWAYRRRKIDADFREQWAQALATGYARLELVLLERAIKGTPKLVRTAKGDDRMMREYSSTLGVALLRRHAEAAERAEAAARTPPDDELNQVCEEILRKLEALRRRECGGAVVRDDTSTGSVCPQDERDGEVETKGWGRRIDLLAWAFRDAGGTR